MLNLNIDTKDSDILEVLRIIQLCDSNFPIGSFNHSYGMETYLRDDKVHNADTFAKWLNTYLTKQFIYSDGICIKMLYELLERKDFKGILDLDRKITVQTIAKESRNGNKLVAGRMIKMFLDLYDSEIIKLYEDNIKNKKAFGHPSIVFGMLMHGLNIRLKEAIIYYIYSTIATLIQNAVRTIPLGQKDGQLLLKKFIEILGELYEIINSTDNDYFGVSIPGIELSQINHENLTFRLFMS
ncbi:MAG: urease accessory protein UreF [Clostridium perfringens]|nr:urease accessory protein UreF [Clostridium perfringens]